MKKILIKSLKELEAHKKDPGSVQFYRGESRDYDTPMMSGIYRNAKNQSIDEISKNENDLFELFRKKVDSKSIKVQDPFPNQLKFYKEWFWLFQAQHLGLKTRLIDFTVDMKLHCFLQSINGKMIMKMVIFGYFIVHWR